MSDQATTDYGQARLLLEQAARLIARQQMTGVYKDTEWSAASVRLYDLLVSALPADQQSAIIDAELASL